MKSQANSIRQCGTCSYFYFIAHLIKAKCRGNRLFEVSLEEKYCEEKAEDKIKK